MTDFAKWLEQLGLAKYAPIFSENEVELADLSELSEDDLKEIGLPLGPRHRIVATGTVLSLFSRDLDAPDAYAGLGAARGADLDPDPSVSPA